MKKWLSHFILCRMLSSVSANEIALIDGHTHTTSHRLRKLKTLF